VDSNATRCPGIDAEGFVGFGVRDAIGKPKEESNEYNLYFQAYICEEAHGVL
jgi:hypothetical protein